MHCHDMRSNSKLNNSDIFFLNFKPRDIKQYYIYILFKDPPGLDFQSYQTCQKYFFIDKQSNTQITQEILMEIGTFLRLLEIYLDTLELLRKYLETTQEEQVGNTLMTQELLGITQLTY